MSASDPEQSSTPDSPIPVSMDLHQHHVSKILDEVLEEPSDESTLSRFRHPMILDLALGLGLLFAMSGFAVGLFKMYLTHSAEQSITQHNYRAAIAILKNAPLPGFCNFSGSDPEELLNQALYLDAMDKLEIDNDTNGALEELQQIKPGSRYFVLAQEIIEENFQPSSVRLQGGAQQIDAHPQKIEENKPILPTLPDTGSK